MRRKKCLMLLVLHQTYRRPLDGNEELSANYLLEQAGEED